MATAVLQCNFIYKNSQIWPMGSSLLALALHLANMWLFSQLFRKLCQTISLPISHIRKTLSLTWSAVPRFHLSKWAVVADPDPTQLKKKKKEGNRKCCWQFFSKWPFEPTLVPPPSPSLSGHSPSGLQMWVSCQLRWDTTSSGNKFPGIHPCHLPTPTP